MNKLTLIVRSSTHPASRVQIKHQNRWIQIIRCQIQINHKVIIVTTITARLWLRYLLSTRRGRAPLRTSLANQTRTSTEEATQTTIMEVVVRHMITTWTIHITMIIDTTMRGAIRWLIQALRETIWCKIIWTIMTRTTQRVQDWVDYATCPHPPGRSRPTIT